MGVGPIRGGTPIQQNESDTHFYGRYLFDRLERGDLHDSGRKGSRDVLHQGDGR
jgi:hypothetical protein